MLCPIKLPSSHARKPAAIDQVLARPHPGIKVEDAVWTPFTAGPYLVPVTRWVE